MFEFSCTCSQKNSRAKHKLENLHLELHDYQLAPVVRKVDSAIGFPNTYPMDTTIHRINHYPLDSAIGFPNIYPMDTTIHRINHYPLDSAIGFPNTYPMDSTIHRINHHPLDSAIGFANTYPMDSTMHWIVQLVFLIFIRWIALSTG